MASETERRLAVVCGEDMDFKGVAKHDLLYETEDQVRKVFIVDSTIPPLPTR